MSIRGRVRPLEIKIVLLCAVYILDVAELALVNPDTKVSCLMTQVGQGNCGWSTETLIRAFTTVSQLGTKPQ